MWRHQHHAKDNRPTQLRDNLTFNFFDDVPRASLPLWSFIQWRPVGTLPLRGFEARRGHQGVPSPRNPTLWPEQLAPPFKKKLLKLYSKLSSSVFVRCTGNALCQYLGLPTASNGLWENPFPDTQNLNHSFQNIPNSQYLEEVLTSIVSPHQSLNLNLTLLIHIGGC